MKRLRNHLHAAKSYRRESPWHIFLRESFARAVGPDAFSIVQLGTVFPNGPAAWIYEREMIEQYEADAASNGLSLFNVGRPTVNGGDQQPEETHAKQQRAPYRGPVRDPDTGEVFDSIADAGRRLGVSKTIVSEVVSGKRQTAGGRRLERALPVAA